MFTIRTTVASAGPRDVRLGFAARLMHLVLALAAAGGFAAARAADALPATDRQAIETTIRAQLDAFGREDADGAFRFASPDIQRMFRSSDAFLAMVREHYEPVYRAVGASFVKLESVGGQWVQTVQLVDDEGRVWRALFTMRRQPDRSWKVGGCQLVQTSAIAT